MNTKQATEKQKTVPVFVYGTLKEGFPLNATYMDGAKKIGTDAISGFALISFGPYPGLIKLHAQEIGHNAINCRVLGEVWDMPEPMFLHTKRMEEDVGYRTEQVKTDAGREVYAFVSFDVVAGNYSWERTTDHGHSHRLPIGKVVVTQDDLPF